MSSGSRQMVVTRHVTDTGTVSRCFRGKFQVARCVSKEFQVTRCVSKEFQVTRCVSKDEMDPRSVNSPALTQRATGIGITGMSRVQVPKIR